MTAFAVVDGAGVESDPTTVVCEITTVVTPSTLEDDAELERPSKDDIAFSNELDPVVLVDAEPELDADPDEDVSVVEPVPVIDSKTVRSELELDDRFVEEEDDEELDIKDSWEVVFAGTVVNVEFEKT